MTPFCTSMTRSAVFGRFWSVVMVFPSVGRGDSVCQGDQDLVR